MKKLVHGFTIPTLNEPKNEVHIETRFGADVIVVVYNDVGVQVHPLMLRAGVGYVRFYMPFEEDFQNEHHYRAVIVE